MVYWHRKMFYSDLSHQVSAEGLKLPLSMSTKDLDHSKKTLSMYLCLI